MIITPELIIIISLSVIILFSLGLNFILLNFYFNHKSKISFDEAVCVLNTIIDSNRSKFNAGLFKLQKSYTILDNHGNSGPPNDRIREYMLKKQDLKVLITKKIIRSFSSQLREKLLSYYSNVGLVNHISVELDKNTEDNLN